MRPAQSNSIQTLSGLVLLAAVSAGAQRSTQQTAANGMVIGSVTCSDTNLPARFASVALEPVREPGAVLTPAKEMARSDVPRPPVMLRVYQTHLNGTFQIPNVRPGRYYVVVENAGYLSPVAQFTQEQVNHPTPELKDAIAKAVPIVTVDPNVTSKVDISLVRAASVSGTIRFDDGSPASELWVEFERKDKDGKFVVARVPTSGPDDQGHFRASGVPPGEYRIYTTLAVNERETDGLFGGNHSSLNNNTGGIQIYSGDTFHKKDAQTFKIEGGEAISADITIPSSKIHSLTGSLVDARTGHAISAGTVQLFDGDEVEPMVTAKVSDDEPSFHLEYVPEGEYTVRVKDARDVTREEIPYPPGSFGMRQYKETVIKHYNVYEAPLVVQGDQTGLNLPITAARPGQATPVADQ